MVATEERDEDALLLATLTHKISNQELLPGAALREQALSEEFSVSRARVRSAFTILEERGLVTSERNRGVVVARLDTQTVNELYSIREVLEALAVRLAVENRTAGSWTRMKDQFGAPADDAIARGDYEFYGDLIRHFRSETIEAAKNPILTHSLAALHDRTRIVIRRLTLLPGRAAVGLQQHRAIIDAMQAGDAVLAERLKRENIQTARKWFNDFKDLMI